MLEWTLKVPWTKHHGQLNFDPANDLLIVNISSSAPLDSIEFFLFDVLSSLFEVVFDYVECKFYQAAKEDLLSAVKIW